MIYLLSCLRCWFSSSQVFLSPQGSRHISITEVWRRWTPPMSPAVLRRVRPSAWPARHRAAAHPVIAVPQWSWRSRVGAIGGFTHGIQQVYWGERKKNRELIHRFDWKNMNLCIISQNTWISQKKHVDSTHKITQNSELIIIWWLKKLKQHRIKAGDPASLP